MKISNFEIDGNTWAGILEANGGEYQVQGDIEMEHFGVAMGVDNHYGFGQSQVIQAAHDARLDMVG